MPFVKHQPNGPRNGMVENAQKKKLNRLSFRCCLRFIFFLLQQQNRQDQTEKLNAKFNRSFGNRRRFTAKMEMERMEGNREEYNNSNGSIIRRRQQMIREWQPLEHLLWMVAILVFASHSLFIYTWHRFDLKCEMMENGWLLWGMCATGWAQTLHRIGDWTKPFFMLFELKCCCNELSSNIALNNGLRWSLGLFRPRRVRPTINYTT